MKNAGFSKIKIAEKGRLFCLEGEK